MLQNADEIHVALTKRLRKPPSQHFWEFAIDECWVDAVLDAIDPATQEEELDHLVERWKRFERHQGPQTPSAPTLTRVRPADATLGALSLILAAEAKWLPEVVRFRQRILGGVGVPVDEIKGWMDRQFADQGHPTVSIHQAADSRGTPLPIGDIVRVQTLSEFPPGLDLPALLPLAVRKNLTAITGDSKLHAVSALEVAHADPGHPGIAWSLRVETLKIAGQPLVPIDVGGILGGLKTVAQQLARSLGFDEAGWARYLLAHEPPHPDLAVVNITTGPAPPLDRVHIEASPLLGAKPMSELYAEARKSLSEHERDVLHTPYAFDHPLSEKNVQLAIFIAQQNDGRSMPEAMKEWNDRHTRHAYNTPRNFDRDARAAYRRITGQNLRWRRRRGRSTRN